MLGCQERGHYGSRLFSVLCVKPRVLFLYAVFHQHFHGKKRSLKNSLSPPALYAPLKYVAEKVWLKVETLEIRILQHYSRAITFHIWWVRFSGPQPRLYLPWRSRSSSSGGGILWQTLAVQEKGRAWGILTTVPGAVVYHFWICCGKCIVFKWKTLFCWKPWRGKKGWGNRSAQAVFGREGKKEGEAQMP